mmetsp:Transcript_36945/g.35655  ORF Transcript_36945/g.35655 Transcript_36945/m.35655 type:complete len:123 (-) Transcript_36945:644-1012(-)|eukprot:CAMPEP_0170547946 /NCGR_PEP_ID=MMETSP0211-20121228/6254_1 /TAXON_ID=311385 /ORGANISM="Pseudokeronopsis sp., Strain OXSARD2" /LENGTH=122 /DNA_ID=CAMNT_0010853183 /DNA_START=2021 /DNA_END=2389 /DNA_ORIENTATION=+
MVLNSVNLVKGVHKLKLLLKRHTLSKKNFIYTLKVHGTARLPEELKITRYPPSCQFYDPIPEIVDKYTQKYFLRKKSSILKITNKNPSLGDKIKNIFSPIKRRMTCISKTTRKKRAKSVADE